MYYAQPPVSPGYEFYEEAIRAMIKFRDKRAVETICEMMNEINMEIKDDLAKDVNINYLRHKGLLTVLLWLISVLM